MAMPQNNATKLHANGWLICLLFVFVVASLLLQSLLHYAATAVANAIVPAMLFLSPMSYT